MKIGTKSVLYGAHCFLLHPFFVAIAWIKLYGFPFDPRIWIAFFVHDLGYLGKPNMDGPEGETHVELGGAIMHLFDGWYKDTKIIFSPTSPEIDNMLLNEYKIRRSFKVWGAWGPWLFVKWTRSTKWRDFSIYHSRYYAKKNGAMPSRLCFADKLSFTVTPRWLYLPMVNATGEINEYLKNAKKESKSGHWRPVEGQLLWHKQLREYMIKWVAEHKDGSQDTWTNPDRHAVTESGVWK